MVGHHKELVFLLLQLLFGRNIVKDHHRFSNQSVRCPYGCRGTEHDDLTAIRTADHDLFIHDNLAPQGMNEGKIPAKRGLLVCWWEPVRRHHGGLIQRGPNQVGQRVSQQPCGCRIGVTHFAALRLHQNHALGKLIQDGSQALPFVCESSLQPRLRQRFGQVRSTLRQGWHHESIQLFLCSKPRHQDPFTPCSLCSPQRQIDHTCYFWQHYLAGPLLTGLSLLRCPPD